MDEKDGDTVAEKKRQVQLLYTQNKDLFVEVFDFDEVSRGLCPQAFRENEWRSARFAD